MLLEDVTNCAEVKFLENEMDFFYKLYYNTCDEATILSINPSLI